MSYEEDLSVIKEEIAKRLGISLSELDEELRNIRSEAPGLISEKLSLLLLIEREGIIDQELVRKLSSETFFSPIIDLRPGMQGITVIGRIIRFLRSRYPNKISLLLRDKTGEAVIVIHGRNVELFKKMGFEVGDLLMIKNANVSKSSTFLKKIIVDDESEIYYLEEADLIKYQIGLIPRASKSFGVSELLRLIDEESPGLQEINVRGIVSWIGNLSEVKISKVKKMKKMTFGIRDERNLDESIRVIAWGRIAEDISKELKINQIILLEGCSLKENQYLTKRTGKKVFELHVGNLSNFRIIGLKRIMIDDLKPGLRAEIYAYVLSNPIVKSFIDRDNKEREVLYCYIGDESAIIRLVVWRQDIIEVLKNLSPRTRVQVTGSVRESKFNEGRLEIHVSSEKDTVKIEPNEWPKELEWESVKKIKLNMGHEKRIELINDFSRVPLSSIMHIEGYLKSIKRSVRKEGPLGIASLVDKNGNEVVLMIWNEGIVNKLESLKEGTPIRIMNVRSPRSQKADIPVLFAGDRSKLTIIKNRETSELSNFTENMRSISNARTGIDTIFGTVIDVLFIGERYVCPQCGLPIVSKSGEGDVCPRGHIVKAVKKLVLVLLMDDDIRVAKAILTGERVKKIVEELGFNLRNLMSNKDLLDLFKLKFVGQELLLKGEVSEESLDTDFTIVIQEILRTNVNKLKNAIQQEQRLYNK